MAVTSACAGGADQTDANEAAMATASEPGADPTTPATVAPGPTSTPTPMPRPVIPPLRTDIFRIRLEGTVPPADVESIATGLAVADEYFKKQFGFSFSEPLDVRLTSTSGCGGPFGTRAVATGGRDAQCHDVAHPNWAQQNVAGRLKTGVHESFHALQQRMECPPESDILQKDHLWLFEGAAEYFGLRGLGWAGLGAPAGVSGNPERYVAQGRQLAKLLQQRDNETLRDHERALPTSYTSYELFVAGMAYLLEFRPGISGSPESSWMAFCRAVGSGVNWRTAFAQGFGISTEDFYSAFNAWAAESPPQSQPTTGSATTPTNPVISAGARAGATRIEFSGIQFNAAPVIVRLNRGGANDETVRAPGLSYYPGPGRIGYLLLDRPLKFDHAAGEPIELAD